jgi:hypothetical protein
VGEGVGEGEGVISTDDGKPGGGEVVM